MQRKQKFTNKKRRLLKILSIVLLVAFVSFIIGFLSHQNVQRSDENRSAPTASKNQEIDKSKITIYPTFYVTGSSGTPKKNMQILINDISSSNDTPAKPALTIIVKTKDKYQVVATGEIKSDNKFPMISIGMDKGTDNHEVYQYTIKAAVEYLKSHYNIPWCNILGYSSGAGGSMRYLINYSKDKKFPQIKKFIALDGEFNQKEELKIGENLESIYKNGPENKSSDYLYFEDNYKKIDSHIQVVLMGLDLFPGAHSDGTLPWSDLFSVYNLFEKNGNMVNRFIFNNVDKKYTHGTVWKMPIVQQFIKQFFYQ